MNRILFLLPFVFAFSSPIYGQAPAPGSVEIKGISYGGPGCRQGTVGANISSDNKAMTLLFDDFIVDSSEGANGLAKKSCNVKLQMQAPPGWAYNIFCVDYRGFAFLDPGVIGTQSAALRMEGGGTRQFTQAKFSGPFEDDYSNFTQVNTSTGWSPCTQGGDHTIDIDTTISVDARGSGGGGKDHDVVVDGSGFRKVYSSRWHSAGSGYRKATNKHRGRKKAYWTFRNVPAGTYNIFTGWKPGSGSARNAPYKLTVNGRQLASTRINQTLQPAALAEGGHKFGALFSRVQLSGTVELLLTNDTSGGWVYAGPMKLRPVGAGTSPGEGLMTVDSIDGEVSQHYGVMWRRCGNGGNVGKTVKVDGPGFHTDFSHRWHSHGNGYRKATKKHRGLKKAYWTFKNVRSGRYNVFVNWKSNGGSTASNAPYRLKVNGRQVALREVNQRNSPKDLQDGDKSYDLLFSNVQLSGTAQVWLSNEINSDWVIAGSVKIIPAP